MDRQFLLNKEDINNEFRYNQVLLDNNGKDEPRYCTPAEVTVSVGFTGK